MDTFAEVEMVVGASRAPAEDVFPEEHSRAVLECLEFG